MLVRWRAQTTTETAPKENSSVDHFIARLRVRGLGMATRLFRAPTPFMFTGPGSSAQLVGMIADCGARSVFVVTDAVLLKLKVVDPVLAALDEAGLKVYVFSEVEPDPAMDQVMAGVAQLRESRADAVLAVGGGSPIDAAKAMIACHANGCRPDALEGYFKVRGAVTPFFAIPTTAGTGSEVTVVSVVSDPAAKRKFAIVDNKLVPVAIALDPNLMVGLPPAITAATGMDALTHAVESYVSTIGTPATRALSVAATRAIVRDLPRVYDDGRDIAARQTLAVASCQAGLAFTKASVGYVHAISHQVGAQYHLPHGYVNAVLLPYVLEFYVDTAARPMAELARACGLGVAGDDERTLALAFIAEIRRLNTRMDIPATLDGVDVADIPELVRRALAEAHGTYPVPKYMSNADCDAVVGLVAGRGSAADRGRSAQRPPRSDRDAA
jgi:alcohol dehydrogenase class IV